MCTAGLGITWTYSDFHLILLLCGKIRKFNQDIFLNRKTLLLWNSRFFLLYVVSILRMKNYCGKIETIGIPFSFLILWCVHVVSVCSFCLLFLNVHLSWILFSWIRCGIRLTKVFLVNFFFLYFWWFQFFCVCLVCIINFICYGVDFILFGVLEDEKHPFLKQHP